AGVADRIRWLGPRTDVGDLVHAADLFTLSSEREGLSISLLEAMRGSRAAVVTRVGGSAEALVEGESGHLVPPHDPVALGQALARLALDPARREDFTGRSSGCWTCSPPWSCSHCCRRSCSWPRSPSGSTRRARCCSGSAASGGPRASSPSSSSAPCGPGPPTWPRT